MNRWKETPFAKLLVDSKDGEWGAGEEAVGLREAIIVRGTDFADLNNPAAEFPKRWIKDHLIERKKLGPGDIILETAGGTSTQSTGRSALLKESFFQQHRDLPVLCASFSRHLRLDTENYSPQFTYYLLQTLHRYGYMAVFNIQHTGVSRFQYTAFKNHTELSIPDLPTQQKIAAILSAYDELIENNKRRIALLEKLAEEIYREWFVRLRFPGYEKARTVKGVPEGWVVDRVDSIGKVITGKTPSTSVARYYGEPYLFIKTPDMHGNMFVFETEEKLSQDGLDSQRSQTIPEDSICVSCIGTGGVVSITTSRCQTNQQINSVVLRDKSDLEWAFFTFRNLEETIRMFGATGTTMTNLSKGKFSSLKILRPDKKVVLNYHASVRPMFDQMRSVVQQTKVLSRLREILLPRLISGKLSVENLDIQFPPGMIEELKAERPAAAHA